MQPFDQPGGFGEPAAGVDPALVTDHSHPSAGHPSHSGGSGESDTGQTSRRSRLARQSTMNAIPPNAIRTRSRLNVTPLVRGRTCEDGSEQVLDGFRHSVGSSIRAISERLVAHSCSEISTASLYRSP